MTNNRVLNVSRGYTLKHKQAERAVAEFACAWVVYGVSVRSLSLAESIAARIEHAQRSEPIAQPELPGLVYEPPAIDRTRGYERRQLVHAANRFFAEAV
jgi:hypothetical protein